MDTDVRPPCVCLSNMRCAQLQFVTSKNTTYVYIHIVYMNNHEPHLDIAVDILVNDMPENCTLRQAYAFKNPPTGGLPWHGNLLFV